MSINHRQLTFVREYLGFNQSELAQKIPGMSQSNLSKFEKGFSTLSEDIIDRIIDFLGFPKDFYFLKISNKSETAHYRQRTGITKKVRSEIEYGYRLIGYLVDQMAESVIWPELFLKPFDLEEGYNPTYVARHTRKLIGLSDSEPVVKISELLEASGIIIVEVDIMDKFDGVSFVSDDGYPVMVINRSFSNDRKRFTIAHELGHLLMHSLNTPAIPDHRNEKIQELEANQFASEFLMPASAIKGSLSNLRLSSLSELKMYWLTSMLSIVKRARDLNCINNDKYIYLNIEISRGGRVETENSVPVFIDQPRLFSKAYTMHKTELGYTDADLSSAFSLPQTVIKKYCDPYQGKAKLRVLV